MGKKNELLSASMRCLVRKLRRKNLRCATILPRWSELVTLWVTPSYKISLTSSFSDSEDWALSWTTRKASVSGSRNSTERDCTALGVGTALLGET